MEQKCYISYVFWGGNAKKTWRFWKVSIIVNAMISWKFWRNSITVNAKKLCFSQFVVVKPQWLRGKSVGLAHVDIGSGSRGRVCSFALFVLFFLLCGPVRKKNLVTWEDLQGKVSVNRLVSCHHWLPRLTWRKTQPLFYTFFSSVRAAALSNATFLASSFCIRQKLNDTWLSLSQLLWKQL